MFHNIREQIEELMQLNEAACRDWQRDNFGCCCTRLRELASASRKLATTVSNATTEAEEKEFGASCDALAADAKAKITA